MTKAQETKARRAAVVAILGEGWTATAGVEGASDKYNKKGTVVMPQRTIDGNFYVGSCRFGFRYTKTIEEAAELANKWAN